MNCHNCHQKFSSGYIDPAGFYCSTACADTHAHHLNRFYDKLLSEGLTGLPDEVELFDLERFTLRIAVHCYNHELARNGPPMLARKPEIFSLIVMEQLLKHVPAMYFRAWRNPEPFNSDYSFRLTAPLPRELVIAAAQKAGILQAPPRTSSKKAST